MNRNKKHIESDVNWPNVDFSKFQYEPEIYIWKLRPHGSYQIVDGIEFGEFFDDKHFKINFKTKCIEVRLDKTADHAFYSSGDHFREVFNATAIGEEYDSMRRYNRLVIPIETYLQFNETITFFKLQLIKDFLLETIAITQEFYANLIDFWNTDIDKSIFMNIADETEKAIKVIEQSGIDLTSWNMYKRDERPILKQISFKFNKGTIRIDNVWLAREFILHMKNYYDNLESGDWRTELSKFPDSFNVELKETKFKHLLIKSYYNLFTKSGLWKVSNAEPTPNKLLLCIAQLMELSLIPVGDFESDEVKIKNVRNWFNRG
jgi:hypothetical protein